MRSQRDEAAEEALSILAHELQTPLTAIRGFAELLHARDDERTREQHAGDDGRGRGAEPAALRDPVRANQLQAAWLAAEPLEHGLHRAHDQVRAVAREVVGTLAGDVDHQAVLADARHGVVVARERQPERVEARAEIRRRRRDADVNRSGAKRGARHVRPAPDTRPRRARRPER